MIVRKYEEKGLGSNVEFWIADSKVYCMITDAGGLHLTTCLDYNDIDDLRDWLYSAMKQIEPKNEQSKGL